MSEREITLEDLTYGTSDKVLYNETQAAAHIIDAKFTRVAGNHMFQVRTYGAGFVEECIRNRKPIFKVTVHVVAPRLNITESAEYEPIQLLTEIRAEIEELYERIDNPWNPPTPHGDLCGKCARAGGCPALNQTAVSVARGVGLPLPSAFSTDALVAPTDRALAQAVAQALENWAEQIKRNNTEYAKQGGDIPGYALRTRSTGARVSKEDTPTAYEILKASGYSPDAFLQACRLSLNDLAKIHASTSTDTEKGTKERLRELLSAITSEGEATYLQKTKRVSEEQIIKQLTQGTTV